MTTDASTHEQPDPSGTVPSPVEMRAEFERMIVADLIGPVGGEDEQLLSASALVRDRYMLGALAPASTVGIDPERNEEPAVEGDVAPDLPGETTEHDTPAAKLSMFPSSIGLSCVVEECDELVLSAVWGKYVKEVREPDETEPVALQDSPGRAAATGGSSRVWQRYSVSASVTISLREGGFGPLPVTAEHPGVVVRGRTSRTRRELAGECLPGQRTERDRSQLGRTVVVPGSLLAERTERRTPGGSAGIRRARDCLVWRRNVLRRARPRA